MGEHRRALHCLKYTAVPCFFPTSPLLPCMLPPTACKAALPGAIPTLIILPCPCPSPYPGLPTIPADMGGRGRGANPLAHVLQALGEPLDLLKYKNWNVLTPEGQFLTEVGVYQFCDVLQQIRGPEAVVEWKRLQVRSSPAGEGCSG